MFDEPLQEVELVKEKTVEFPSYSTEYLDDVIRVMTLICIL